MPEETNPNVITSAIEFWHRLNEEKEVIVKFTKKDGTVRIMRCTLDFSKIPKLDRPKTVDITKILNLLQSAGIIHVYDLDKKGWRSVPFQRVEYLKTRGNVQYKIQPMKRTGVEENVYSKRFNR
jgi:WYL_2, Sm-like SH3 beta-barrel fold